MASLSSYRAKDPTLSDEELIGIFRDDIFKASTGLLDTARNSKTSTPSFSVQDPEDKRKLVENAIAKNKKEYPRFTATKINYDPNLRIHGDAILETQGPGATDQDGNSLNDTDGFAINIGDLNDKRIIGNLDKAILGDMLHTLRGDPEWEKMLNDVYGLRDEWQKSNDLKAYIKTVLEHYDGDAEKYPIQNFENYHRKDAYARSIIAPDNNAERWTNEGQEAYINDVMLPYLRGSAPNK